MDIDESIEEREEDRKKADPCGLVNALVMTEQELHINALAEHIQSNAECLERFMFIVCGVLPHTSDAVAGLMAEWTRINNDINSELKRDLEKLKEA